MPLAYKDATQLLERNGQGHLLRFWDELDEIARTRLLAQVESLDFASAVRMVRLLAESRTGSGTGAIQPAKVAQPSAPEREAARHIGEDAIRKGEIGVILVAGGQGSRLGFEGPKGCFLLSPITHSSLFSIHARKVVALEKKYGCRVPFYIMTSESNDGETRAFFEEHRYFGLCRERVKFFTQGMWPALSTDGKIILDGKDHVFMSPDGHGGILAALRVNGMLDDMEQQGLKSLFYFQVDNPLIEIADPAFIGLHRKCGAQMSVKVCAKRDPEEGLGVVVERNGRHAIVEYTELTREQKHETLSDGRLRFQFGSVAIHVFSLDFLKKEANAELPLHVAHKKVPYCDENGKCVAPDKPNAYKFEKFIFDALPDAEKVLNYEFAREDEFSPVKNATGSDSPEMARRDMIQKWARWLETCGISVPRTDTGDPLYKIEIDPCFALGPDDLSRKLKKGFKIAGDLLLS